MPRRSAPLRTVLWLLLALALPARAEDVTLTRGDLVPAGPGVWTAPGFALPEPEGDLPLLGERYTGDGAQLLRHLNATSEINGFDGFVYDNRDRGHSTLRPDRFPRLARLVYGDELVAEGLDYGLAGRIILPAVVFGNSSTAITSGALPRSQTRLAMTSPQGLEIAGRLYFHNHIYVYPEHRDHDAEDRFPANWPYTITSQGSSGSDRRFLRALAMTLAAFRPDTFARLRDERLVAPTVQMILRRNLSGVASRADYLSGRAHPVVFPPERLRPGRMVAQAHDMRPGDIPPMVRLAVVTESFADAAGLAGMSERFFDTPSAIARIWRGFVWRQEMVVSAAETQDPNARPLSFEWRLLQGDRERVRIEPLDAAGRSARITVDWHDPFAGPVADADDNTTRSRARVDIGVFANNGVHDSAPALISISFPAHQDRRYGPGPDGGPRLISVDYDAVGRGVYFDPILHWSAPWRDVARYDAAGALTGWDRTDSAGSTEAVAAGSAMPAPALPYRIDRSRPAKPILRPVGK